MVTVDEAIKLSKFCEHEHLSILLDFESTYHDAKSKRILKTKNIKQICNDCKLVITKEFVIDVDNKVKS